MRPVRIVVALWTAVALAAAPASSSPRALGVVLHAENAGLDGSDAIAGASIFSGDKLSTTAEGTLRLRLAAAQLYLLPNAAVELSETQGWQVADLRQGGVGFSTAGGGRIAVRVDDAQVYPASAQPTHAEIRVLHANELLVTSLRGPLEIMVGGDVRPLASPGVYRVLLGAEVAAQDTQPAGRRKGGAGLPPVNRRRVLAIVLVTAAIGGAVAGIVLYNTREPASPYTPPVRLFPAYFGN